MFLEESQFNPDLFEYFSIEITEAKIKSIFRNIKFVVYYQKCCAIEILSFVDKEYNTDLARRMVDLLPMDDDMLTSSEEVNNALKYIAEKNLNKFKSSYNSFNKWSTEFLDVINLALSYLNY